MISFDLLYLILLVFLANFLPGAIFSFAILKEKKFLFIEKLLIGFAIGFVVIPVVLFLLSFVGILFSNTLVLALVGLFYLISLFLFWKNKSWEGINLNIPSLDRNTIITIFLILIILIAFVVRMIAFTPIFQELDPYFYIYGAYFIITQGEAPFNDQTAWYPELQVNHRNNPAMIYLESMWYSLYTGDGEYNNYLLALVGSLYPPLAAMFAVFFLYLFLSSVYKREFGLIGAASASLVLMFILKLLAGEYEAQPYTFFSFTFFLAMYSWAIIKEDKLFAGLAAFAFMALQFGSGAIILPVTALIIFIPLQSLLIILQNNQDHLKKFIEINLIFFIPGFLIPNFISGLYKGNFGITSMVWVVLGMIIFAGALYFLRTKVQDHKNYLTYVAGILIVGLLLVLFTPLGDPITGIAKSGLSIGEYTDPLKRTIQEQAEAGGNFEGALGFLGDVFPGGVDLIFAPISFISNLFLMIFIGLGNAFLGTELNFSNKANSMLLVVLFFVLIALAVSLYRNIKRKYYTLVFLFLAVMIPPTIIGILKIKFTLYMGFFLAAGIGLVLGEFFEVLSIWFKNRIKDEEKYKKTVKDLFYALIAIGIIFVFLQFIHNDHIPSVLSSSLTPRFQDDPLGAQPKLQELCETLTKAGSYNAEICGAATDPIGYASKGINYQYSTTLCVASLVEDITNLKTADYNIIQLRCNRISDYWVESMEWLKENTEEDARVISWWDYGHWINFFGQRNAVIRNEHASTKMIGEVAYLYLAGTPEELKDYMIEHDSKYALFDGELLIAGSSFGGKYGALNYLSCAHKGKTDVSKSPGTSLCEMNQLWETVYIPKTPAYTQACTISKLSGTQGITAFKIEYSETVSGGVQPSLSPVYCVGQTQLINGQTTSVLYYLDKTYENGDLQLNKAFLFPQGGDTDFDTYTLFYDNREVWVENGELKSGYEDASTQFYKSNLFRGYFLKDLPGFDLVFEGSSGTVKIYKIK